MGGEWARGIYLCTQIYIHKEKGRGGVGERMLVHSKHSTTSNWVHVS